MERFEFPERPRERAEAERSLEKCLPEAIKFACPGAANGERQKALEIFFAPILKEVLTEVTDLTSFHEIFSTTVCRLQKILGKQGREYFGSMEEYVMGWLGFMRREKGLFEQVQKKSDVKTPVLQPNEHSATFPEVIDEKGKSFNRIVALMKIYLDYKNKDQNLYKEEYESPLSERKEYLYDIFHKILYEYKMSFRDTDLYLGELKAVILRGKDHEKTFEYDEELYDGLFQYLKTHRDWIISG